MTAPDAAIRAKRKLTNRLIAAHDAPRLRPHFTDDIVIISGDGGVIQSADLAIAILTRQFAEPGFIDYVRTTETVEIAADGHRAAETGRWVAHTRGAADISGSYMAAWRENRGQWLIERELFVTLEG